MTCFGPGNSQPQLYKIREFQKSQFLNWILSVAKAFGGEAIGEVGESLSEVADAYDTIKSSVATVRDVASQLRNVVGQLTTFSVRCSKVFETVGQADLGRLWANVDKVHQGLVDKLGGVGLSADDLLNAPDIVNKKNGDAIAAALNTQARIKGMQAANWPFEDDLLGGIVGFDPKVSAALDKAMKLS
jgi:hypothetical protein